MQNKIISMKPVQCHALTSERTTVTCTLGAVGVIPPGFTWAETKTDEKKEKKKERDRRRKKRGINNNKLIKK